MKPFASFVIAAVLAAPALTSLAQGTAPQPAAAAPASAKPDLNAGSTKYAATCAACHGTDGNSGVPANPKIAQQHPEYLVKQLQEFKNGRRPSQIMKPFADQLSEADMRNISYWIASQKAKPGFARDKELVALGERIYRGGILEKQVAACAGCHSPNGAGIPAQYPRLSGQHADYTHEQLRAFQNGVRKNSQQMTDIATRLSEREMRAVSDYIAGLR